MAKFEISGYELYEMLGRGGMATVYRALHLNLDREVAIKIMDNSLNADGNFSERFLREARISARLFHPHIVQVYDVNAFGALNYISMELLSGGDLADFIRGPLSQATIYKVMEQMTRALDYASSKGYVHRDIKPSNIMLRGESDYVLGDFGIAKAANSNTQMTQAGLMVGTPSYMSPEQARGIEVDGRSDLYSLAILCYEMLTKELPYGSDSAVSVALMHLTEPIPTLPEKLAPYQAFMNKALAKEPEDRYQSGREMYLGLCEVRDQFADDDILINPSDSIPTVTSEPVPTTSRRVFYPEEAQTVATRDAPTRAIAPVATPQTEKLSLDSRPESLVSGIRGEQRIAQTPASAAAPKPSYLIAGILLVVALGFGGYLLWQGRSQNAAGSPAAGANQAEEGMIAGMGSALQDLLGETSTPSPTTGSEQMSAPEQVAAIESALGAAKIEKAAQLLDAFSKSFPDNEAIERLRAELELASASNNLSPSQAQQIGIFLGKANTALALGNLFEPRDDNAYQILQKARALDANNIAVGRALDKLVNAAVEKIYTHIDDKAFEDARIMLSRARLIDEDLPALVEAENAIEQAEAEGFALAETSIAARESEINARKQEKLDAAQKALKDDDYRKAGQLFGEVLALEPESSDARRGLEDAVASLLKNANSAIKKNDYARARDNLKWTAELAPENTEAERLLSELPQREKAWRDKKALAAEQKVAQEIADEGAAAIALNDLNKASQTYQRLADRYPDFGGTVKLRSKLLTAYTEAARQQISDRQYKQAEKYIADGESMAPGDRVWTELRQELDISRVRSRRLDTY